MDPSSLSKPSPEQGLPLSNVAGSKPKTEPTTPTKEQIKEIAKKSIPTPRESLELVEKQITDANQVLQEFYKLAKEMRWEVERDFDRSKALFNIKDSKADFDLKSKKVITPKPIDILKFLVAQLNNSLNQDRFIQRLKLKEGNYPLLKNYFTKLEEFVSIVKNIKENDGLIDSEPLRQIIAIANKNSSDVLLLIPLMRNNLSVENFVKVIKQLIRENLGKNDVPFFKGSIVLEALGSGGFGRPIKLEEFWDKDLTREAFFEKISLNVPGLLKIMAESQPRYSTETLKYFLKCDNKNMAWEVVLDTIFYEPFFRDRKDLDIESFLDSHWPPEEKALKDLVDSFVEKHSAGRMFERMVSILSDLFKKHKSYDLQKYLSDYLFKVIGELLEVQVDDLGKGPRGLEIKEVPRFMQMIFQLKIFSKDTILKIYDLLIEKFEKIGESKIKLQQEMEQMNGLNLNPLTSRFSGLVDRIEEEDLDTNDLYNSEVMRKKDILQALSEIEDAIVKLKKAKEILQQQP